MSQVQAILDHVPPALLVIFRIGGIMVFGPLFGSSIIPGRIKVMLAFIIGLAVYPILADSVLTPPPLKLELFSLAPIIAMELLIGMVIGYIASIPLTSMQMGGLMIGQQMGLGFARFFNPAVNDEADVIGQVLFFMGLAAFLIIGGPEMMLIALLNTFEYVPLGGFVPDLSLIDFIVGLLLASFELGIRIAAPVLAIVFMESVVMGFVAKTVPQINILSLGFPLRIISGFALVAIGLTVINDVMMDHINEMLTEMFEWVDSLAHKQGM
ncbi:MAG: flagellar biosynthetic protein FliR [Planctomycetes bacterium]|nr:flagellar biosynthetic protein FliR [Planctomycetota bacterium]MCH7601736.1 flagellar biosynthetic protein FliR [Planctomycetota bacterium]